MAPVAPNFSDAKQDIYLSSAIVNDHQRKPRFKSLGFSRNQWQHVKFLFVPWNSTCIQETHSFCVSWPPTWPTGIESMWIPNYSSHTLCQKTLRTLTDGILYMYMYTHIVYIYIYIFTYNDFGVDNWLKWEHVSTRHLYDDYTMGNMLETISKSM